MRVTETFERTKLDADDIKRIIDAAAAGGVKSLSFTGGETFLYYDELISLISYAGNAGIEFIRTGTNGFLFMNSDKPDFGKRITALAEAMAKTKLRNFWISIDSSDPSIHEQMRGLPGVISGIKAVLPIFHAHGIYPSANLGINRNTGGKMELTSQLAEMDPEKYYATFKQAFTKFYGFVEELGFTIVNACYPMSIDAREAGELSAVYAATSVEDIVSFTAAEKVLIFQALSDTLPLFRHKMKIFTPRVSLYALIRQYQNNQAINHPCHGGIDFFFISARDGNTYPCGYRGNESLGKFWDLQWKKSARKPFCQECDWECFRDPSLLIGNFIDLLRHPLAFVRKALEEPEYLKLWLEDLNYYRACDYYDGRRAPDYQKLKSFCR
jgi:MoaA/NifB/PqqE/SkfB family radical SAM enzyme